MFTFSMKRLQSRNNRKTLGINMCHRTGLTASESLLARLGKRMAPVVVVPAKPLICPTCRRYAKVELRGNHVRISALVNDFGNIMVISMG